MRKTFLSLLLALCLLTPAFAAQADTRTYYEIFPASFYDSDGDGMGDLNGIAEKIPYLKELGVGGVWLMPIHPSPSYHKYDVTDYYAVDPAYGTLEDLDALVALLSRQDMVLLMDLVVNHTSDLHPWFQNATASLTVEPCGQEPCAADPLCRDHNPYVGYYHFVQEAIPGWHAVAGAPGWFYQGGFSPDMPDLELSNPAVRQEIAHIMAFWLERGVGGFRLDAAAHYFDDNTGENVDFLAWLMQAARAVNPDVYVVGEVWKDAGTIARYYDSGLSSLFNFPFSGAEGAIVAALRGGNGYAFAQKAEAWGQTLALHPGASDAPFLSNHDNARIAGTLVQKPDKLKMAASLYLTLPGTPFLYYGEEIGMTGSGRDENKRLPMVWDAADPVGQCLPPAGADQQARFQADVVHSLSDPDSLLHHYAALLSLRGAHPALRTGRLEAVDSGIREVCAYRLIGETEELLVLHNLGDQAVALRGIPGTLLAAPGEGGGQVGREGSALYLPPMTTAVLEIPIAAE